MPTKHNKKRYQSEEKPRKILVLTGDVYLLYADDEKIAAAKKGDVQLFASCKELHITYQGAYEFNGFVGYFKVDVFDGFAWHPVILNDIFTDREQYFTKHECPIDTYRICEEILHNLKGRELLRTYREHYELVEEDATHA